eukprot:TRINITY_DN2464_c2_g1_i2.p1 TRINITY_DN2464_c2_g1~~TRINITY_DN2464_c2_g1_i2.p1  ORF type:complete len:348 (-),score=89.48 TRINITY_DN2464_c2_g1_i2:690-1733(-)
MDRHTMDDLGYAPISEDFTDTNPNIFETNMAYSEYDQITTNPNHTFNPFTNQNTIFDPNNRINTTANPHIVASSAVNEDLGYEDDGYGDPYEDDGYGDGYGDDVGLAGRVGINVLSSPGSIRPIQKTSDDINIHVIPSVNECAKEKVNRIEVLFTIESGEKTLERAPLNLVILLDRSRSMETKGKLKKARAAILEVIESLGEFDIISLVVYDSTASIIFKGLKGNAIEDEFLFDSLRVGTGSGTNLGTGIEKASEILKELEGPGYCNRMFIFSDGKVNKGIVEKSELLDLAVTKCSQKILISAFGLGSDFDEELMRGIAECGRGVYFYIEGSGAINNFVKHAIDVGH